MVHACAAGRRVGRRDEGIGAEVDVEHRRLGAFEKYRLLRVEVLVKELDRVGHVGHKRLDHRRIELDHLLGVERLGAKRRERAIRLCDLCADEIKEVGLQDVADAHTVTTDLSSVGGTDSATGSANLVALGARGLLGLVDSAVPLHDHVRALGDMEAALELKTPAFDLFKLFHEVKRVHYDAVADHAVLAVMQDTRGNEVENVFLVSDDYGVARVRAALEADYDIRLFRQEVDNLALAFIAPLGANEYSIHNWLILYQIEPPFGAP